MVTKSNTEDKSKDKQIAKIYAIAKWGFGWGRMAMFNYALETCPELKDVFKSEGEMRTYPVRVLWEAATTKQLSKIIQRLEQIEKNNLKNKSGKEIEQ